MTEIKNPEGFGERIKYKFPEDEDFDLRETCQIMNSAIELLVQQSNRHSNAIEELMRNQSLMTQLLTRTSGEIAAGGETILDGAKRTNELMDNQIMMERVLKNHEDALAAFAMILSPGSAPCKGTAH